jgi:phospholipid transport system substrate-binding protein
VKILIYMFLKLLKGKVLVNLILLLFFSNIQSAELAADKVKKLHENLLIINFSEKNFQKKILILDEIVGELFNSNKMIKFIYGRKWKDLDKKTKNKLGLTFQKYISFNYVKRFNNIQNLEFEFLGFKEINEERILVKTYLKPSNEEKINLDYIILKEENNWKIFDVLLNGSISEIATKKSEFNSIIRNKGATGLIEIITSKIESYKK